MTSSKAVAGGIGGAIVVVINWLLTLIPGWATIPDEPRGAITYLASTLVVAGLVYAAPANARKADA